MEQWEPRTWVTLASQCFQNQGSETHSSQLTKYHNSLSQILKYIQVSQAKIRYHTPAGHNVQTQTKTKVKINSMKQYENGSSLLMFPKMKKGSL